MLWIRLDIIPLQDIEIFLTKGLFRMMRLLVFDVTAQRIHMCPANGKRATSGLPAKLLGEKALIIDPFGGVGFDFLYKCCRCHIRPEPRRDMNMVRHAIDLEGRLSKVFDDANDVFVQLFFKRWQYQSLPVLHGADVVDVDFGKGVWHGGLVFSENFSTI